MVDLARIRADLRAESADLDALIYQWAEDIWTTPTPAPGWTVGHQIGHLAWTDEVATLAICDPPAFRAQVAEMAIHATTAVDDAAAARAALDPYDLIEQWRAGRAALDDALTIPGPGEKINWFGPRMSPASMATARLMETWAHGQDIADAVGLLRLPTARLQHVAHIGVRTRDFAYLVRDRTPPAEPFRVELTAPNGAMWEWGPVEATQRVTGPALDFCLLVTQRRNRADLAVVADGTDADAWLDIAQAFAGPPGEGRVPGQFS